MKLMSNEYMGRLRHWQRTIQQDFYMPVQPIAFEGFTTMAQLSVEEASQGRFAPILEGFRWGHTWEYMWVRATVEIPTECTGQTVVMDLHLGGEATLFVNGQAFGTRRAEWVETPHHYMVDNILTSPVKSLSCSLRCTRGIITPMWADAPPALCCRAAIRILRWRGSAQPWAAALLAYGRRMPTSSGWMFPPCRC